MTRKTLKQGDTGAEVCALQGQLCALGWDVPVTGGFDADTVEAVRRFQDATGLHPTGVASADVRDRIDEFVTNNQSEH